MNETHRVSVEKYPFLIIKSYWDGEKIPEEEYNYEYTWYDEIPKGWAKAFGEQMCDELLEILEEGNFVNEYQIVQVKEKFGGLRWYDNGVPKSIWDKHNAWLDKYEALSYKTCVICGKPSTCVTSGWVQPVCQECYDNMYKE